MSFDKLLRDNYYREFFLTAMCFKIIEKNFLYDTSKFLISHDSDFFCFRLLSFWVFLLLNSKRYKSVEFVRDFFVSDFVRERILIVDFIIVHRKVRIIDFELHKYLCSYVYVLFLFYTFISLHIILIISIRPTNDEIQTTKFD